MTSVRPLPLRLVLPKWTAEVPSPPHDGLSSVERREHLRQHPASYLAVTRAPDDVEPGQSAELHHLLEAGKKALEELLQKGVFGAQYDATYFVYRLSTDSHSQTGIVCGLATSEYDSGQVRIHERIKGERADHLANHFEVVGAQSSPIALTFEPSKEFSDLLAASTTEEPALDFVSADGLRQQIWALDSIHNEAITASVEQSTFYLIDGHHRAAAASRFRHRQKPTGRFSNDADWMLSVAFPFDQIRNHAFHRIVSIADFESLQELLNDRFAVRTGSTERFDQRQDSELAVGGLDSDGNQRWLFVDLPFSGTTEDPLADLDPARLSSQFLKPVLGIDGSAPGSQLRYRSGPADADSVSAIELAPQEAIFVMRPVPIEALVATADKGLTMPPKSTYFLPKVRSGLFLRTMGEG